MILMRSKPGAMRPGFFISDESGGGGDGANLLI